MPPCTSILFPSTNNATWPSLGDGIHPGSAILSNLVHILLVMENLYKSLKQSLLLPPPKIRRWSWKLIQEWESLSLGASP